MSNIPGILSSGKIVTNVFEKVSLFNDFFKSQCTRLTNTSELPVYFYKAD